MFTQAGLRPFEALRAATINAAKHLGVSDSIGRVAPGMVADFVVLDANPLRNITNTMHISAVVVRGRLIDRAALDKMRNP